MSVRTMPARIRHDQPASPPDVAVMLQHLQSRGIAIPRYDAMSAYVRRYVRRSPLLLVTLYEASTHAQSLRERGIDASLDLYQDPESGAIRLTLYLWGESFSQALEDAARVLGEALDEALPADAPYLAVIPDVAPQSLPREA